MNTVEILWGPLLFILGAFSSTPAQAQSMLYQQEIRALAQEVVSRAEQRGCQRAKFLIRSQAGRTDVNQLFTEEITQSFINSSNRLEIINERTWNTLDSQRRNM